MGTLSSTREKSSKHLMGKRMMIFSSFFSYCPPIMRFKSIYESHPCIFNFGMIIICFKAIFSCVSCVNKSCHFTEGRSLCVDSLLHKASLLPPQAPHLELLSAAERL